MPWPRISLSTAATRLGSTVAALRPSLDLIGLDEVHHGPGRAEMQDCMRGATQLRYCLCTLITGLGNSNFLPYEGETGGLIGHIRMTPIQLTCRSVFALLTYISLVCFDLFTINRQCRVDSTRLEHRHGDARHPAQISSARACLPPLPRRSSLRRLRLNRLPIFRQPLRSLTDLLAAM